jgi:hypothetical protein
MKICERKPHAGRSGTPTLRKTQLLAIVALTLAYAPPAQADIAFTTGAMTQIFAPVSFVSGDTESSTTIAILDEGVSVLPADTFVNAFGVGVHDGTAPPYLLVPMGTRVHSYIVHFDPIGSSFATLSGSVFFDPGETIIGVQTHTPLLYDTDAPLGHPMATYPPFMEFRAFEFLPGTDTVTLPPGMASAAFTMFAELGIDQARILTTPAIPEPATLALFGLAAVGITILSRSRRRGQSCT